MFGRYYVMRDDRGRWGLSRDGFALDPDGGAYRTPSEALDVLRAMLGQRGLEAGPVLAYGGMLVVEVVPAEARKEGGEVVMPEEKLVPRKLVNRRDLIAAAVSLGLAGVAVPSRAGETGPQKPWYLSDYIDGIWHLAVAASDGPFVDTIYVVGPRRPRRVSTYTIYLGFAGELVSTVGTYGGVDADAIAGELSRRHAYPVVRLPLAN